MKPLFKMLDEKNEVQDLENTLKVLLDGAETPTLLACYASLHQGLGLPSYFSNNLDSLFDCLCDLSEQKGKNIVLVIRHYDSLLHEEEYENKMAFVCVLRDVLEETATMNENKPHSLEVMVEPSLTFLDDLKKIETALEMD